MSNDVMNISKLRMLFHNAFSNVEAFEHQLYYEELLKYYNLYGGNHREEVPGTIQRMGIVPLTGFDLMIQVNQPPVESKGTVFVMHGLFDHQGLYARMIQVLLQAGYTTISWDWPGHGLSSGARATIDDFDSYTNVLDQMVHFAKVKVLPEPYFALGQSMGGGVLADYLLQKSKADNPFKAAVMLVPFVEPKNWGKNKYLFYMMKHFVASTKRDRTRNSHDAKMLQLVHYDDPFQHWHIETSWLKAMEKWMQKLKQSQAKIEVPLLALHSLNDETVDAYKASGFLNQHSDDLLERWHSVGHNVAIESATRLRMMMAEVTIFLEAEVSRLKSLEMLQQSE